MQSITIGRAYSNSRSVGFAFAESLVGLIGGGWRPIYADSALAEWSSPEPMWR
jgi:hypothetical protein